VTPWEFGSIDELYKVLTCHSKVALIIDATVLPLIEIDIQRFACVITIEAKEAYKTREEKARIEDVLLENNFDKESGLVAVGGGITLDLAGFVASTFLRGVSHYFFPTTLLGMVDAAFGGKTAVNTSSGKNLIGSFHLPKKVIINLDVLKTLPMIEWQNGFAEIVKYALIGEDRLYPLLKESYSNIKRIVELSIHFKQMVVTSDFKDTQLRNILNFGHTVGHALELSSNYQIPHGISVYIGMLVESQFSRELSKFIPFLWEFAHKYTYPLENYTKFDESLFLNALKKDKKADSTIVRIVTKTVGKSLNPLTAVEPFDLLLELKAIIRHIECKLLSQNQN